MADVDVIVVGAGLIGITVAYELSSRGQRVELLEARDGVALETSYANGGLLTPSMSDPWNSPGILKNILASLCDQRSAMKLRLSALPFLIPWGIRFLKNASPERYWAATRANYLLASYSTEMTRQLRNRVSLSYDALSNGTLKVFRDLPAMEGATALMERLAADGLHWRSLTREALLDFEPALRPIGGQLVGALHFPNDEVGDAHLFCRALARRLVDSGTAIRTGIKVKRIISKRSKLVGIETGEGILKCGQIVVAAGYRTAAMVAPLGLRLPIKPVKGYSVTVRVPADHEYWPRIAAVDDAMHAVVVPLGERIRVAGTAEFAGEDRRIRAERVRNLVELLGALYPRAAAEVTPDSFERWTGLRPVSADGVPFVGATSVGGLFVSSGHGHLGWTMAMGSACLLADIMLGARPAIEATSYSPMRYS